MTLFTASLRHSVIVALLSTACGLATAQDPAESNLSLAIQQLSSGRYEVRQQAFRRLVSEGYNGIVMVESSVDQHDLEISRRCVEILAAIAQQKGMREAALESLDRLADNTTRRLITTDCSSLLIFASCNPFRYAEGMLPIRR